MLVMWLLILIVVTPTGGVAVAEVHFHSRVACTAAAETVVNSRLPVGVAIAGSCVEDSPHAAASVEGL